MKRSRISEALATIRGAIFLFCIFGFPFVIFGAISLDGMLSKGPLEDFRIGNVEVPKYQGAGASFLDMFIFCAIALIALTVAIYLRYRHHKTTLDFFRKNGMTDIDGDGKVDSFADDFLDDI